MIQVVIFFISLSRMNSSKTPPARALVTYETFFCVHSKSPRTSRASRIPSWKRSRVLAKRAWACLCRSMSSRCLAFSLPDLRANLLASIFFFSFSGSLVCFGFGLQGARCGGVGLPTYVCAWTAMLRSRGMGLKECEKRSCM